MPKLSKHEKSTLERLLHDAVFIRDRGNCRRCHGTSGLSASHIYPKGRYQKMRYYLDNVVLLCYSCHIHWWHKHPIEAAEWIRTELGDEMMTRLRLRANYVDKTPVDYKLIKLYLEQFIKDATP